MICSSLVDVADAELDSTVWHLNKPRRLCEDAPGLNHRVPFIVGARASDDLQQLLEFSGTLLVGVAFCIGEFFFFHVPMNRLNRYPCELVL